MSDHTPYTPGAREVLKWAKTIAARLGHDYIGPEHFLLGILRGRTGIAIQILRDLKLDPSEMTGHLERLLETQKGVPTGLTPNFNAKQALLTAKELAVAFQHGWVGTEHLLLALLKTEDTLAGKCLRRFGLTFDHVQREMNRIIESGSTLPETSTAMPQPTAPAASQPTIGLVLASQDEFEELRPAVATFKDFGCPCEIFMASVWAAPERLLSWAERAEARGVRVVLATAGIEPQLPGFIAAASRLPVIILPLPSPRQEGARPMELALQTSPAAPVASVAPGAVQEAALLAMRILALADPAIGQSIEVYRQTLSNEISAQHQALIEEAGEGEIETAAPPRRKPAPPDREPIESARPSQPGEEAFPAEDEGGDEPEEDAFEEEEEPVQIRPANLDRPLSGKPAPAKSSAIPAAMPARVLGRLRVDPDAPDYHIIEEAIDCLLEGGVIAFPTETVYGLAADATNPAAVERLFELKGRPRNKAITLMVDSPKLLGHIACNLTVEARRLMEAFWPGPLTIIFQKRGENFRHVSDKETIGVRLPDHSIPLAIMQALARPLACTSANMAGQPECFTADEVERVFAGKLNLILDGGRMSDNPPSTVIDVTGEPYRILRQGAVTRAQIAAVVGDMLDME